MAQDEDRLGWHTEDFLILSRREAPSRRTQGAHPAGLTPAQCRFYSDPMIDRRSAPRRQSQRRQSGGGLLRVHGVGALVWGSPR
jgi:hypothetical protein